MTLPMLLYLVGFVLITLGLEFYFGSQGIHYIGWGVGFAIFALCVSYEPLWEIWQPKYPRSSCCGCARTSYHEEIWKPGYRKLRCKCQVVYLFRSRQKGSRVFFAKLEENGRVTILFRRTRRGRWKPMERRA